MSSMPKEFYGRGSYMRKFLCLFSVGFAVAIFAQTSQAQQQCPVGLVCITPEAARAALEAGDRAKALQTELDTLKSQTIPQLKDALAEIRVQYAETKGEVTILKQRAISDAALIELLTKMVRPKKFGIINF
jgi:hypothetical protein